jgi:hypothetical protein
MSSAIATDTTAATTEATHRKSDKGIGEYAPDPELIADAVVVYVPMAHHALEKLDKSERTISGRVDKLEKGRSTQMVIVHKANTMIRPLHAGVPVKMYLKRFPDRDAYYPIAIFSVNQGDK